MCRPNIGTCRPDKPRYGAFIADKVTDAAFRSDIGLTPPE